MMLLERPPCPPSTVGYAAHLSKSVRGADAEVPWKSFRLTALRTKDSLGEEGGVTSRLLPQSSRPIEPLPEESQAEKLTTQLSDLPAEIQETVLDILIGNLNSLSSSCTDRNSTMRNWNSAMRHPRRKQLSDLALVSQTWRHMVQQRLYRHVKIKGTTSGLQECLDWFGSHSHLKDYVRHIEIWVPVWERRAGQKLPIGLRGTMTTEQHAHVRFVVTVNTLTGQEMDNINQAYQLASHNGSLEDIFECVGLLFPAAYILTIEGGHCKKPPLIQHFRNQQPQSRSGTLSQISSIRTLILKGAWNIMREQWHFELMAKALPNMREWHCTYAKPKIMAYHSICNVLNHFPSNLTHLNLCLEGFYSKDTPSPVKMHQLQTQHHMCRDLGQILPQLEALTLTGRVCSCLFTTAIASATSVRKPRMKSIDLIVKNCCRDNTGWNDSTGIHNWAFIKVFADLVTAGVSSLQKYPILSSLRIRFIDLDSPCPLLNPYFQLQDNVCTGIWNPEILSAIESGRPGATFAELSDEIGCQGAKLVEGHLPDLGWPRQRPRSIKVASYAAFGGVGMDIS